MGAAYNPADWSTFFSAEAGAAAALTGLLFVSVSINLSNIIKMGQLVARSAKALAALMGILLASTLCMVPAQPVATLGSELAVLGVIVWLATTRWQHMASHENRYVNTLQRILQMILTQLSAIPLMAGGVSLIFGVGGGLYWLVAGTVFAF